MASLVCIPIGRSVNKTNVIIENTKYFNHSYYKHNKAYSYDINGINVSVAHDVKRSTI